MDLGFILSIQDLNLYRILPQNPKFGNVFVHTAIMLCGAVVCAETKQNLQLF
jgi:hypothetical protein